MEVLGNGEGRRKLNVEDYLDIIEDRSTISLTVRQLREIISMHGFKKIEAPKNTLTEMVASMELMDLHRSTLLDCVSSDGACLTLKAVINDLKFLNWQDCHVTSVLTYGAGSTTPSAGDRTVSVKRKRPRKSGKKAVKVDADDSVISATGTTTGAGRTTGKSAH